MRAQRIVRGDGALDQIRVLRTDARIDVLAPVAVGPSVEGPFADRGQIVGHQLRPQFVAFVDDGPQGAGGRFDGQGGRIANAGGEGAVRAGLAVDGPDDGAVLFHGQAALADIAVRADAHIQGLAVRAGGQRLGPVVVDRRRQLGHFLARRGDPRLARLIVEPHQGALFGDIEGSVHEGHAVGRVQIIDEGGAHLGLTVAVGVAQQGDAVAALNGRLALGLDDAGDDVLGPQLGGVAARALGDQDVAVGQDQDLTRDLQIGGHRGDDEAVRHGGRFAVPADRVGDLHRRHEGLVRAGKVGIGAGLVQVGVAAAAPGQGQDDGGRAKELVDHHAISRTVELE